MMRYAVVCCLLLGSYLVRGAPSNAQESQPSIFEEAYNLYSSCSGQDLTVCLKLRALGMVDRAARAAEINIVDGLKLVKSEDAKSSREARSLNDIEASLPADKEARETAVDEAIIDRAARFLSTHTLEVSYPEDKSSRSLDEARGGKKKKLKALLPIFLLLKLKALALVPILIGGLALLAFKALVVAKIALVISAILAFQKLFGNKGTPSFDYAHQASHDDHHDHHQPWGRSFGAQPAEH